MVNVVVSIPIAIGKWLGTSLIRELNYKFTKLLKFSKLSSVLGILLLYSCDKAFYETPPSATPLSTYQAFWQGYEDYYVEFELKKINWDSMRQVYEPQITENTSDEALYEIFKLHLDYLKDAHSSIYPLPQDLLPYNYVREGASNFLGIDTLTSKYLELGLGNSAIRYSWINNKNIGYIWIRSFSLSPRLYVIIDDIVQEFENADAIIIDVRDNGGGSETLARSMASRFVTGDYTYSYVQRRTGNNHELTTPEPFILEDKSFTKYTGKVALLTNRKTFSAAEGFALMLRGNSNLIHVGDATQGGSGTTPIVRELPNGWSHRLSSVLLSDANQIPIIECVQPTHFSTISPIDSIHQVDRILEDAIQLLQ